MLAEFLRRFREGGVPGAPAAAGVPGDAAAALETELAPVFALLEATEHAADRLEEDGRRLAEQRRTAAAEQARALVADAHARAAGEQAAAAAARLSRTGEECEALQRRDADEAGRIEQAANERVPALVAELVGRVLAPPPAEQP